MIRLCSLLFCCLYLSTSRAECENGWKSFRDALLLRDCQWKDGDLLDIVDAEENEFIHSNLHDESKWYHIGLNDRLKEGTFEWISGAAMGYSNFWPGKPSNSRDRNCGELRYSGLWNDVSCIKEQNYIYEKKVSDVREAFGVISTKTSSTSQPTAQTTTLSYN
ncbi:CLEC17A [Mytilus coruscus]|uniref:CLEC17A n=1 Tax=Mytilus coruscus TaxID=42192 RepID=A0A6J8CZV7_MYTCO|nr:CLEC17A [Mytilus coruscus]